jgi:hypothetical protein
MNDATFLPNHQPRSLMVGQISVFQYSAPKIVQSIFSMCYKPANDAKQRE